MRVLTFDHDVNHVWELVSEEIFKKELYGLYPLTFLMVGGSASCDATTLASADISGDDSTTSLKRSHDSANRGRKYMTKCEGTYPK